MKLDFYTVCYMLRPSGRCFATKSVPSEFTLLQVLDLFQGSLLDHLYREVYLGTRLIYREARFLYG